MEIIANTADGQVVYIGDTENRCVVCGAEIPEGRDICPNCERNA